jgi:hypothetical protein
VTPQAHSGTSVQGVVRRDAAHEIGALAADLGIIVVQLETEHSRIVDLGVIDLDLVGLTVSGCGGKQCDPADGKVEHSPGEAPAQQRSTGQGHGTSSISAARRAPR